MFVASFAFCVKTFEPIIIQTCSTPQNDCQNCSFWKDTYVDGEKLARNGQKMATYYAASFLPHYRGVLFLHLLVFNLCCLCFNLQFDKIKGQKISKAIFLPKNELKNSAVASKMVRIKKNVVNLLKGQTISKANYGVLNSPKKRTKWTQDTILSAFQICFRDCLTFNHHS